MTLSVAVVMPALNEGPNIRRTVESIMQQTRVPDEIIVADGGSTDDTAQRVAELAEEGTPIRLVKNPGKFCGAGRNRATEVTDASIIINMDFGNRADERFIEAMADALEREGPDTLAGGPHIPIVNNPFEQACAGVLYFKPSMVPTLNDEDLLASVPNNFMPGGMSIAWRRELWEKAGGYCNWIGTFEDKMFSLRVLAVNGRIVAVPKAVIHHHMMGSISQIAIRQFRYCIWIGRTMPNYKRMGRILCTYLGIMGLLIAGVWFWPTALLGLLLLAAHAYLGAIGKALRVCKARGWGCRWATCAWAFPVRLAFDLGAGLGHVTGFLDGLLHKRYRQRVRKYLERGVS